MAAVQLEFSLYQDEDPKDPLSLMSSRIDQIEESMGKVRRKLFCEISELKKLITQLKETNSAALSEKSNAFFYEELDRIFNKYSF